MKKNKAYSKLTCNYRLFPWHNVDIKQVTQKQGIALSNTLLIFHSWIFRIGKS